MIGFVKLLFLKLVSNVFFGEGGEEKGYGWIHRFDVLVWVYDVG